MFDFKMTLIWPWGNLTLKHKPNRYHYQYRCLNSDSMVYDNIYCNSCKTVCFAHFLWSLELKILEKYIDMSFEVVSFYVNCMFFVIYY